MAAAITYNVTPTNAGYVYRTTGGGVTFSANLTATAVFDYFSDTAVVNDALYIAKGGGQTSGIFSDVNFNVGTALTGTGIMGVWEYYNANTSTWVAVTNIVDNTVGFTATGAKVVQFPYQTDWGAVIVNGVAATGWVRYRLTAITTITEGGANRTTACQVNDGKLSCTGYTIGSPCTFTALYNYMNTNYSYVGCKKVSQYFDFRWVSLQLLSYLFTTHEVIESGINTAQVNTLNVNANFSYLQSGYKVGSYNGRDGSTFIINAIPNSAPYVFGANTKCYGSNFLSFSASAGYPGLVGEFMDCRFECAPGGLSASSSFYNNKWVFGSLGFIASVWDASSTFVNQSIIVRGTYAISGYQTSWSIRGFDVSFTSPSIQGIIGLQQTQVNSTFDFVNPINPFPRINDATGARPIIRTIGTEASCPNVFFYDDSAATYVDYTTQAASATTADVPIWGDVNDCLYYNPCAAATDLRWGSVTSTIGGTNDYVYAHEYYYGGAWVPFTKMWDETTNLVKSGMLWGQRPMSALTSITINGVAGFWYRIRIVTKGTGYPMIDKLRYKSSMGCSDWEMWERYEINYNAKNSAGANLAGVEVRATDVDGAVAYTGTTDANGLITATPVKGMKWYFDPLSASGTDTVNKTGQKDYNPYSMTSRKYGYLPQTIALTMTSVQNVKPVFQTNTNVVASQSTAHAYTGIAIDGVAKTITVSGTRLITELYDYSQDWYSLTANMAYDEPITTTDGITYTLTSGWSIIVTGQLTSNTRKISGTVTVSGNGYFETLSGAVWASSGHIYYGNKVTHNVKNGTSNIQNVNIAYYCSMGTNRTYNSSRVAVDCLTTDVSGNATGYSVWKVDSTACSSQNLIIKAYGYTKSTLPKTLDGTAYSETDYIVANPYVVANYATASAYTGITVVANTLLTMTTSHTIQELFDYCDYWNTLGTNLNYSTLITSTDGIIFNLLGGLTTTITGQLTSDTLKLTGNIVVSSGGYFETVLGAMWESLGNVYYGNKVIHNIKSGVSNIASTNISYYDENSINRTYNSSRISTNALTSDINGNIIGYAVWKINSTLHDIQNLIIKAYGYNKVIIPKVLNGAVINEINYIVSDLYKVANYNTAGAYTGIAIIGNNSIVMSNNHTMQELYDYSQWWATQTTNLNYETPITTNDGTNYVSTYDFTIDNAELSGNGSENLGTHSLELIGTAKSSINITYIDGTQTNIILTGITNNSRVQLYDISSSTELYNDITGTTLTFPYLWTTNKQIRIRVMYVNGANAKKWYETTATVTSSGINLNVIQEDDTVYNKNLVYGSTVTECSIEGTTLVVNVDDPDNKTTAQRIYAYEVYWLFTEGGIRDQNLYIDATDQTHYILEGGLKIKNLDMSNPLNITGANLEPITGSATDILDTTGGMILINPETVVPFAYNVNGATEAQFNELISKTSILDRKVDDTQTRVITLTE